MPIHFANKSGSKIEQYPVGVMFEPFDKNVDRDNGSIYTHSITGSLDIISYFSSSLDLERKYK